MQSNVLGCMFQKLRRLTKCIPKVSRHCYYAYLLIVKEVDLSELEEETDFEENDQMFSTVYMSHDVNTRVV